MNALISMHQHAKTGKQFRAADLFFGVMLSATGAVGCLFLLWPHIKKLIIELRPAAQSTTSKAPTTKRFCREAMALC